MAVRSVLDEKLLLFCLGDEYLNMYEKRPVTFDDKSVIKVDPLIKCASTKRIDVKVNFADRLMYIYTSGTTGLPKASIITHHKVSSIACTPLANCLATFSTFCEVQ